MPLSDVALYCLLESNPFFVNDILFYRDEETKKVPYRLRKGQISTLYEEYREKPDVFYQYISVSVKSFDYMLAKIEAYLQNKVISNKRFVTVPERLFLTLRYLAQGTSFKKLSKTFNLSHNTVAAIIYKTLKVIWKVFAKKHMPEVTMHVFKRISTEFYETWQFPNCVGTIGEKHFQYTKHPKTERKTRKNYKILALQGVVDANLKFIDIEVGEQMRHDSIYFFGSKLNKLLMENKLDIPPPQILPHSSIKLPYMLIGDESYPLKTYIMRPYVTHLTMRHLTPEQEVFNDRLSTARTSVNCAFGILTRKWQILNHIETNFNHASLIVKVTCLLHNIVRDRDGSSDVVYKEYIEDYLNTDYQGEVKKSKRNNRTSSQAIMIRDQLKDYFVNLILPV